MIEQVLARQPLTEEHARLLDKSTGIPARFWLALEHNYRVGLAAGLRDVTEDEPAAPATGGEQR
jgi:plasmid maintenance system antidote protein VapI